MIPVRIEKTMTTSKILTVVILLLTQLRCPAEDKNRIEISAPVDDGGFRLHTVRSPYQAGTTKVRVLLPDAFDKSQRYRVLYVLPVEALDGRRWGSGLQTIRKAGLHNRHKLICVAPTFSHLPWYADHPSDPMIRQESYLTRVVLPLVEIVRRKKITQLIIGEPHDHARITTHLFKNLEPELRKKLTRNRDDFRFSDAQQKHLTDNTTTIQSPTSTRLHKEPKTGVRQRYLDPSTFDSKSHFRR